jgi:hypothetical protein
MIDLVAGLRTGLTRVGRDEPVEGVKAAELALTELAPAIECASRDSEPKATAKALRSTFVAIAARLADDAYLGGSARMLLEASCREHEDAAACARVEQMKARPERVPLPLAEASPCEHESLARRGAVTISVTAEGSWIDDTAYGTDLAAFERALPLDGDQEGVLSAVVVFAEPTLAAARVQPTLEALARRGATEIGIVVEVGGSRRIVPVKLSTLAPPTEPAGGGGVKPDPPAKKGLYAMKRHPDEMARWAGLGAPSVLHLGPDLVELRTPEGTVSSLDGMTPAQRREAVASSSLGLAVELGATTPWARLGVALETSCSFELLPPGP